MRELERIDRRVKIGLLVVSVAAIAALGLAALRENVFAEWRHYRRAHRALLRERATDDRGRAALDDFEIRIVQSYLPDLDTVDRCRTCHAGIDDPRMTDVAQPFRTHPGRYLDVHDPAKFGCTVCHEGQGRATEVADAHGSAGHWERPLLEPALTRTTCTKCHTDAAVFGSDLLRRLDDDRPGAGAGLLARGRRLAAERGCLGCHLLGGRGGVLGPDLTRTGEKTAHELSFALLGRDAPHTVPYWLRRHFVAPAAVSPGSVMPPVSPEDAEALTAWVLSRRDPLGAIAPRGAVPRPALSGETLYGTYCAACHGPAGMGSRVDAIRTPSIGNRDFLATADDDYLRFIIENGRSHTEMPAWGAGRGNLTRAEIDRIVAHVRSWEAPGPPLDAADARRGDAERGRARYRGLCAGCHGLAGEGGIGNTLRSATFLALADDRFLARSIVYGRPGTAMPAWRQLSIDAVNDLLAYLRSWQPPPPTFEAVGAAMRAADPAQNVAVGAALFRSHCAACHGDAGQGRIGPAIAATDYLRVVDDGTLHRAIVEGRPSTAMPAWRHLSAADVGALIAYLRTFDTAPRAVLAGALPAGDPAVGSVYYGVACRGCHGEAARGGVGPQLANPVFLDSVSDAALFEWIAKGRTGTAMRAFLAGAQGPTPLTRRQILDVIAYLRALRARAERPVLQDGAGNAALGAVLYAGQCAACHGGVGEGASGPQLNNPAFLDVASDGFLAGTIVLGRTGTPMQSMVRGHAGLGQLAPDQVADVVAFLRGWQSERSWRLVRRITETSERAVAAGSALFGRTCAGCHGPTGRGRQDGEGYYAPALNNPEFLHAASDGFLLATIARGRSETPMRAFGLGGGGIGVLRAGEISDIVAFIRTWQAQPAARTGG